MVKRLKKQNETIWKIQELSVPAVQFLSACRKYICKHGSNTMVKSTLHFRWFIIFHLRELSEQIFFCLFELAVPVSCLSEIVTFRFVVTNKFPGSDFHIFSIGISSPERFLKWDFVTPPKSFLKRSVVTQLFSQMVRRRPTKMQTFSLPFGIPGFDLKCFCKMPFFCGLAPTTICNH